MSRHSTSIEVLRILRRTYPFSDHEATPPLLRLPNFSLALFFFAPFSQQAVAIAAPPILLRFPKAQEGGVGDGAGVGGETSPAMDKKMTFIVGCLTTNDAKKSGSGSFEVTSSLSPRSAKWPSLWCCCKQEREQNTVSYFVPILQ